jgi:hypothetical protein
MPVRDDWRLAGDAPPRTPSSHRSAQGREPPGRYSVCCARVLHWMMRRSIGAPFGPSAAPVFATASCLREPAFAGMTVRGSKAWGRNEAARPRWSKRDAASCDTHSLTSVEGDGAEWPKGRTGSVLSVPIPSSDRACRVGGLDRPFLLATSLDSGLPALRPSGRLRRSPPLPAVAWASKEK